MAFQFSQLLGSSLQGKGGVQTDTDAALASADYVLLYFSAHWCPPCRRFTPELGKFYEAHGAGKKFEVVFISSDHSEPEFASYFGEHAWHFAVPYDSPLRTKLGQKFRVQGIPTLAVVDKAGETLTTSAVQEVMTDQQAQAFPWRPKSFWETMGTATGPLIDAAGGSTPVSDLKGKDVVALYFSAHWCPPCRGFTPTLAKWYTDTQAAAAAGAKPSFELVFVSSDRDEGSFKQYLAEMPWKALPLADRALKGALSQRFGIEGIPALVFLNGKDGSVITTAGREKVESAPGEFPWPPKAVTSLADAAGEFINDVPTAVLFTDMVTDAPSEARAVEAFTTVANEVFAAAGGRPSEDIRFAIAAQDDEALDSVRKFLGPSHMRDKDGPDAARVTIINVQEGRKAMLQDGALGVPTAEAVRALVADFLGGAAKTVPIKS